MKQAARVRKLEAKRRASEKGRLLVIVAQDMERPDVFHSDAGGSTYSSAELDRLSQSGTLVVRICHDA